MKKPPLLAFVGALTLTHVLLYAWLWVTGVHSFEGLIIVVYGLLVPVVFFFVLTWWGIIFRPLIFSRWVVVSLWLGVLTYPILVILFVVVDALYF